MIINFSDIQPKPYIIAELSSNHANNFDIVIKSIEAAAKCGADAIKTQLYTASSLTLPDKNYSPIIDDKTSPWFGQSLFDLYEEASLPYEWYPKMIDCAKDNSIDLFASVFDSASLEFALNLKLPLIKVSSFELIHLPLLRKIEKTNIPTIISTGMALLDEIEECVEIFKDKKEKLCLLKCTSDYPSSLEDTHIGQMKAINEKFNINVGLSDHSLSNLPSIVACVNGAKVIEKHFILDKNLNTPDSFFSLDKSQFALLVDDIRAAAKMIITSNLNAIRQESEAHSLWERPSIYFARDLYSGYEVREEDLIIRRPSFGLKPSEISKLIGKKLKYSVKKFDPTQAKHFY